VEVSNPPESIIQDNGKPLDIWLEAVAGGLGLEIESALTSYGKIKRQLRSAAPALLRMPAARFLLLLEGFNVLGPDLKVYRAQPEALRSVLYRDAEASLRAEVQRLLEYAGVPKHRQDRSRMAILDNWLKEVSTANCWLLRVSPGTSFRGQLRQAGLPKRLMALVGVHMVEYALWILSWWMVGRAALQGRFDAGWLFAWTLLLLTMVPFRVLLTWLQGRISIAVGGMLKERLLYGALKLEPDEIRHQGAGHLLGRVIESEALEALALSGGFPALVAIAELIMASAVLALGAAGSPQLLLLAGWTLLAIGLGWRYLGRTRQWTKDRLWMTHDLVERMTGHRTRLAQEIPAHWHDGEDQALDRYLEVSGSMDRTAALLNALIPRGWLIVGFLGITPAFIPGSGSAASLAIGIGGILMAYRAFRKLATGLWYLAGAGISWDQVAPLFRAAARTSPPGSTDLSLAGPESGKDRTVLEADNLFFRYRDRGEPVLQNCSLRVSAGERILLEGPSGSGKSTLAALLTGLRNPESGLLLAGGLDRQTLGSAGWRRMVTAAPQFHENHVLTGTFAFNLLMGREGVLDAEAMNEAEAICHELGLGELLSRMPAGMLQMVGESGWQLSHGERSRLYIARALLQGAELMVLDESFAALDPESLRSALTCVLNRAHSVIVIAHP
jgi:ATP-binding cassette subfamily B protein